MIIHTVKFVLFFYCGIYETVSELGKLIVLFLYFGQGGTKYFINAFKNNAFSIKIYFIKLITKIPTLLNNSCLVPVC